MGLLQNTISTTLSRLGENTTKTVSKGAAKLFSKNLVNNLVKINSGGTDYVQFPINLLSRSDIGQYTSLHCNAMQTETWSGKDKKTFLGSIYLPLPKELGVSYSSNWSSVEGGMMGTAESQNLIDNLRSGQFDEAKAGAWEASLKSGKYSLAKAGWGVLEASGLRETLEHSIQRVLNPMRLLNWSAPDFRSFTFTWELTPSSGKEAEELNQIIYWVKRYIHSPSDSNDITLKYPPLWNIRFIDAQSDKRNGNKFLFKTDQCAITNVSVDYTAKGNVFHRVGEDGQGFHAPNGIRLSISFTETKILTQSDFDISGYPTDKPTP